MGKSRLCSWVVWVPILAWLLSSRALQQVTYPSVPQFPYLENGAERTRHKKLIHVKCLGRA